MRFCAKPIALIFICCSFLVLSACSSKTYVRHIASDLCLIIPQESTKKDVIALMGEPVSRRQLSEGIEEWVYFQANKSTLRKTPYVGKNLGFEDYDIGLILFKDDLVTDSTYRQLSEKEFQQSDFDNLKQKNAE